MNFDKDFKNETLSFIASLWPEIETGSHLCPPVPKSKTVSNERESKKEPFGLKFGMGHDGAKMLCPILYYFHRYYFGVHKSVHCPIFRSHSGVVEYHLRLGHAGSGSSPTFAILFCISFLQEKVE